MKHKTCCLCNSKYNHATLQPCDCKLNHNFLSLLFNTALLIGVVLVIILSPILFVIALPIAVVLMIGARIKNWNERRSFSNLNQEGE